MRLHLAAHADPTRTLCGFLTTPERVVVTIDVWRASPEGMRCLRCERISRWQLVGP